MSFDSEEKGEMEKRFAQTANQKTADAFAHDAFEISNGFEEEKPTQQAQPEE